MDERKILSGIVAQYKRMFPNADISEQQEADLLDALRNFKFTIGVSTLSSPSFSGLQDAWSLASLSEVLVSMIPDYEILPSDSILAKITETAKEYAQLILWLLEPVDVDRKVAETVIEREDLSDDISKFPLIQWMKDRLGDRLGISALEFEIEEDNRRTISQINEMNSKIADGTPPMIPKITSGEAQLPDVTTFIDEVEP